MNRIMAVKGLKHARLVCGHPIVDALQDGSFRCLKCDTLLTKVQTRQCRSKVMGAITNKNKELYNACPSTD